MRILHICSEYPPQKIFGLGRYVSGLSRAMAEHGHEVHVLTNSMAGACQDVLDEGVHVHRVDFPPPPKPPVEVAPVLAFNLHLQQRSHALGRPGLGNPELVISHDWLTAIAGHRIARRWSLPHVWTVHDTTYGKRFGTINTLEDHVAHRIESWATQQADLIVVNSTAIRREIQEVYRADPSRLELLFPGIDPDSDRLPQESSRIEMFRSLLAEPDEFLITYVGRLDLEKGVDTLINAFALFHQKAPNSRLALAGRGVLQPVIEDHARRLGLERKVTLLGYLEGSVLRHFYRVGDVHVCPSHYEPFGMVAIEAMASGTPIIVSDTGGLRDIVPNQKVGRRVPSRNPEALAEALLELSGDPKTRRELGRHGRDHVLNAFGWRNLAVTAHRIYWQALESAREVTV